MTYRAHGRSEAKVDRGPAPERPDVQTRVPRALESQAALEPRIWARRHAGVREEADAEGPERLGGSLR